MTNRMKIKGGSSEGEGKVWGIKGKKRKMGKLKIGGIKKEKNEICIDESEEKQGRKLLKKRMCGRQR